MRLIAVGCLLLLLAFPIAIYCILAICGYGGSLFKGYWSKCTNIKENNSKENKYVLRIYGIKNLILSVIFFAGIICLIYEQWIAGIAISVGVLIVWGIIEIVLLKCKKYQAYKFEISDEKRQEEYWKNLKVKSQMGNEENNSIQNDSNLDKNND